MPGSIYDWDTDPDQNSNSDPDVPWPEDMPSEQVNDSARAGNGRIAEFRKDITSSLVAGGTANALTVTLGSAGVAAYIDGLRLCLTILATNSGAATLSANSIGTKPIRKFVGGVDVPLTGGELVENNKADLIYSTLVNGGGGGWILLNSVGGGVSSGPFAILRKTYPAGTNTEFASYGAWITMPLDTEEYDPDGKATISANQFVSTVDCWAEWTSIAYLQNTATAAAVPMQFVSRLYNSTDAEEVARSSVFSASLQNAGSGGQIISAVTTGIGRILAGKTYDIRGYGFRSNTNGRIWHHNASWAAQAAGDDVALRVVLK